ncbi:MAG: glutaredoxin family protein [Gammaproteobacteria bacterium]
MTEAKSLVLYGRAGCTHCEQLQFALDLMTMRRAVSGLTDYRYVDVDEDAALKAQYGLSVPVLKYGEQTVCEGVFDIATLERTLKSAFDQ